MLNTLLDSISSILIGCNSEKKVTLWNNAASDFTELDSATALAMHLHQLSPWLPVNAVSEENPLKQNVQHKLEDRTYFFDTKYIPVDEGEYSEDVSFLLLFADVTRLKRAESLLIRQEKMKSLGDLAAGLAHELNNPLAGITTNIQNIQRRISPALPKNCDVAAELNLDLAAMDEYLEKREIHDFIAGIEDSALRAAKIIRSMLDFSHSSEIEKENVDIVELIQHVVKLMENDQSSMPSEYLPKISIKVVDGINGGKTNNISPVYCSKIAIEQVFLNILTNAAQALSDQEMSLLESTKNEEPKLDIIITEKSRAKNRFIQIEFKDNGPGIPETYIKNVFDPFFTTKATGEGTGLGLAISYFIIKDHHNGNIKVTSKSGEGSTFIITLPASRVVN